METSKLDIRAITQEVAHARANSWVARQVILPSCKSQFQICGGPQLSGIYATQGIEVPNALLWKLHLKKLVHEHVDPSWYRNIPQYVENSMPNQFQIESGESDERHTRTFPIAVFVDKIDRTPNERVMRWVLYGKGNVNPSPYDRLPRGIVIWGSFMICCPKDDFESSAVPMEFRDGKLRDCVIWYYPGSEKSVIGIIQQEEPHFPQVVKDWDVLQEILHKGYRDGYFEVIWSDGMHGWGRYAHNFGHGMIGAKAVKKNDEPWDYSRDEKNIWSVPLRGLTYSSENGNSFKGDVFACSDGTILHTYWEEKLKGDKLVQCLNRFYPPGSNLVPQHVIDSYNADMPQWYKNDLLMAAEIA